MNCAGVCFHWIFVHSCERAPPLVGKWFVQSSMKFWVYLPVQQTKKEKTLALRGIIILDCNLVCGFDKYFFCVIPVPDLFSIFFFCSRTVLYVNIWLSKLPASVFYHSFRRARVICWRYVKKSILSRCTCTRCEILTFRIKCVLLYLFGVTKCAFCWKWYYSIFKFQVRARWDS